MTHLGVYCSLSQPGLELVEDDGDGVQLLVGHRGHHPLLAEGGGGHHGDWGAARGSSVATLFDL